MASTTIIEALASEVRRLTSENANLKVENERLQAAKRRALAIADERCKQNVELRAQFDD
jgi:regulator of replication initiation timing